MSDNHQHKADAKDAVAKGKVDLKETARHGKEAFQDGAQAMNAKASQVSNNISQGAHVASQKTQDFKQDAHGKWVDTKQAVSQGADHAMESTEKAVHRARGGL